MERGENLERARQTFLNAGYRPEELAAAIRDIPESITPIKAPVASSAGQIPVSAPDPVTPQGRPGVFTKPLPGQPLPKVAAPKKKSNTLLIIIIIISALVLVGAGILGWKWDTFFGG